jgi:hypothetical protein
MFFVDPQTDGNATGKFPVPRTGRQDTNLEAAMLKKSLLASFALFALCAAAWGGDLMIMQPVWEDGFYHPHYYWDAQWNNGEGNFAFPFGGFYSEMPAGWSDVKVVCTVYDSEQTQIPIGVSDWIPVDAFAPFSGTVWAWNIDEFYPGRQVWITWDVYVAGWWQEKYPDNAILYY